MSISDVPTISPLYSDTALSNVIMWSKCAPKTIFSISICDFQNCAPALCFVLLTFFLKRTKRHQCKCCQAQQEQQIQGKICKEDLVTKTVPLVFQETSHQWVIKKVGAVGLTLKININKYFDLKWQKPNIFYMHHQGYSMY